MKKVLALVMALTMIFALSANAFADDAGFEEIPIWEDEEVAFLNVSAVYFQPVPMAPGQEDIEGFNLHLECDVSAMENKLGYELGSWVPYMTIDFEVVNEATEKTAAEGSFMVMAASDGPHYGANIALPEAGTYTVRFTFHSPAENGYLVHSDAETGPGGLLDDVWGNGPLKLEYKGWNYISQEW